MTGSTRFAEKVTSISHQPPEGSANDQFGKTQFFLRHPVGKIDMAIFCFKFQFQFQKTANVSWILCGALLVGTSVAEV